MVVEQRGHVHAGRWRTTNMLQRKTVVAASVTRCNPAKGLRLVRARDLHQARGPVTHETPDTRRPFDEARLRLVRDFLIREFRGWRQTEYFDDVETAHVFVLETDHGRRHTLAVPLETLEDAAFMWFCNAELAAALKLAPEQRLTLTPHGVRFR
jgi:hypothetical protein